MRGIECECVGQSVRLCEWLCECLCECVDGRAQVIVCT